MRRGLRYLPVVPKGRRRIVALAAGLLAAMSLVWQQQATLASFTDSEFAGATFEAATLPVISPEVGDVTPSSIELSWPATDGDWATPQYQLDWAAAEDDAANSLYTGPNTGKLHSTGPGVTSQAPLLFTDVAAGDRHACGISRGTVYCWGTSTNGALGRGSESPITTPKAVTGGQLGTKPVAEITAGNDFTCARAVDGTAYCWGLGTSGQLGNGSTQNRDTPRQVSTLSAVTSISAGGAHACAVSGGNSYCWGSAVNGRLGNGSASGSQAAPTAVTTAGTPLAGRTVSTISAGGSHTCAVADGTAFCWGLNTNGQLGDSTTTQRTTAVPVSTSGLLMGRTVSRVAAGASHSCGIVEGGAYCWGNNTNGQLGNGATSTTAVPTPVLVGSLSDPVAISLGSATTCAVAGGRAHCWGSRAEYGVGNNSSSGNQTTPVALAGDLNRRTATAISAGNRFGCAVGDRLASCWGLGGSHQLGDGSTDSNRTPGDVDLKGAVCPEGSVRLSDGGCSLVQDTTYRYRLAYSIGTWTAEASEWAEATTKTRAGREPSGNASENSITLTWDPAGARGDSYAEYTIERATSPNGDRKTIAVTGDTTWTDRGGLDPGREFTQVAAGTAHTCGIVADDLYCWGSNASGQLGIGGSAAAVSSPTLVMSDVAEVSAGTAHTCALTTDGTAYCWGDNANGRLGTSQTPTNVPRKVSGSTKYTAISAGGSHTCAIATDSTAYCWGLNSDGQLGDNTTTNRTAPTPVSTAGDLSSNKVTSIAAGGTHTCAVASGNKRAYCWGANGSWQLGSRNCTWQFLGFCLSWGSDDRLAPAAVETGGEMGTQEVAAITAGTAHTCSIAANKAYCWGQATSGQLGDGSNTNTRLSQAVTASVMSGSVSALVAGGNQNCAIAGNAAYCWGLGTNGQLGNSTTSTSAVPVAVSTAGALSGTTVGSIAAGGTHGCLVADGGAYCWGSSANGRLGGGGAITNGNVTLPQVVVAGARCATGATALADGTCSLAPDTNYYYWVTFSLDGRTVTTGGRTALSTSG